MSSLKPETPKDFGGGFTFWAYCNNCQNNKRLDGLDADEKLNDVARLLVCSRCGYRGATIQRVFVSPNSLD